MLTRVDSLGQPYVIRSARPQDAGAVGEILAELAQAGDLILLSPGEVGTDDSARRDEILRATANPDRWHFVVVEQDRQVVGMLDLRVVPLSKCRHVMELGIGLKAGARGHGIGTALMVHAVERARAAGCRKIRLFVIDGNERAAHVYRKCAFSETGRFVAEVRVGDAYRDLVVMERDVL